MVDAGWWADVRIRDRAVGPLPVHKRQSADRFACGDPFFPVSRMPDRDGGTLLPVDGGKRHGAGRHAVRKAQFLRS
jgi:hypothetical protein